MAEDKDGGTRTAARGTDPRALVRRATEQLAEVMGRRPEAVSGFAKDGDGWRVSVEVVDPMFDAASGTFGVRLTLPNPDRKIPAGLKCRARF